MRRSRLLATPILALAAAAAATASAQGRFEYARDPGALVVFFEESAGEIEGPEGTFWLRIHGDGRVRIHHPSGARSAGDYELRLAAGELDDLIGSLLARRLMEFDPQRVRDRVRAAEAARRGRAEGLFASPDAPATSLELRLTRYAPAAGPERRDVVQRIRWTGVQHDARRYPGVSALQGLAAARRELRALLLRSDAVRLGAESP